MLPRLTTRLRVLFIEAPTVSSGRINLLKNKSIICNGVSTDNNYVSDLYDEVDVDAEFQREKKSKAMQAYLKRADAYNKFIQKENRDYTVGKRHLANMMGRDPETFTQEDVNESIEYLFPSGLFSPISRPFMKPPEQVFPPKKEAEFDNSGRPFHYLFYTGKPNYFGLLHDLYDNLLELNRFEDVMIRKNLKPDPNLQVEFDGSDWLKKEELEKRLVEKITDKEYSVLLSLLDNLKNHPYSYNMKEKIFNYRISLMSKSTSFSTPLKPSFDDNGTAYVTVTDCPRKSARATVTVRCPGTGQIKINGRDLSYFRDVQPREQILFPLHFSEMLNKVDVEATVQKSGTSGKAGAIRWGIAWALRSFVPEDMIEKMRVAGLLSLDVRTRERKKPGQAGARKKYTWKKR